MKTITFPLRVGRHSQRAVLDANGIEVVIFPKGLETFAKEFCELMNLKHTPIDFKWFESPNRVKTETYTLTREDLREDKKHLPLGELSIYDISPSRMSHNEILRASFINLTSDGLIVVLKQQAKEVEEKEPYCSECGSTELAYRDQYPNGEEYQCKDCGKIFIY